MSNRQYEILIVEDNPGDLELITEFLEEQSVSLHIFHAKDFKECKNLLTVEKLAVNVILLDLSLPDKNGASLILEMMDISPDIPIIVLTGYADVRFSVNSLALGISDYLLKDDLSSSSLYKSILYSIERKKKSIELEESEKRYSNLFHLSPQPMWVYDLETLEFLDVNDAAIEHYGYNREEFMAMTIRDIRSEEDIPELEAAMLFIKNSDQNHFDGTFRNRKKAASLYVLT